MVGAVRTIEFFNPVDELPQFRPARDVEMVGVNFEQPLASVCENHVEEWGSIDVAEVNRSP